MTEEEKEDILFKIDMQLYNEFNDKIATMNDHLGEIYSLRDIEEVEQAEKEKEIELLRDSIRKQQKEIEALKEHNEELAKFILNLNPKLINIDKNELVIDKNNFAKFKIE